MIQEEHIAWYMNKYGCNRDVAIGSLQMWERGEGEMTPDMEAEMPGLYMCWKACHKVEEVKQEVIAETTETPAEQSVPETGTEQVTETPAE